MKLHVSKPRATKVYKQPREFPNLCSRLVESLLILFTQLFVCMRGYPLVILAVAVAGTDAQATKKFSGPHYYFAEAMGGSCFEMKTAVQAEKRYQCV